MDRYIIITVTGTEAETKEFMAVCVETLKQYPPDDLRTPVFIYERLCSIIYPEENDVGEFFLTLEKDPQQEDFLQVHKFVISQYIYVSFLTIGGSVVQNLTRHFINPRLWLLAYMCIMCFLVTFLFYL